MSRADFIRPMFYCFRGIIIILFATQSGSASALSSSDTIFAQYREVGVLLWRGFSVQEAADQCFSNEADLGKGRQMPVHYGSQRLNFQTISSPLATQLPQVESFTCNVCNNTLHVFPFYVLVFFNSSTNVYRLSGRRTL